jgi:ADP-ribosyl-[dinitrogen reductase] hydrolase
MNGDIATGLPLDQSIIGCILGTAAGDALGLPAEGLSKKRLARLYPELSGHHFLFGKGMISDDTEHTCLVAESLIASAGDSRVFCQEFARRLKVWLLLLPGGTGLATAKAILRLLIGYSPEKSGVFSAGNGPAMRSAILGACYGSEPARMLELVRASTRMTHTDPKAEYGAVAVALAAHWSRTVASVAIVPDDYISTLRDLIGNEGKELPDLVQAAGDSATAGESTLEFAQRLGYGRGVSGYVYATVPVVLQVWFKHPRDYRRAVESVIMCGGDTDTTAAILGGIVGAGVGPQGIPGDWLDNLMEWPRGTDWMKRIGAQLSEVVTSGRTQKPVSCSALALLPRNVFFLIVVLLHGFRRLFP